MKAWTGLTSSAWNGMDLGRNITVDNRNGHSVDRVRGVVVDGNESLFEQKNRMSLKL